MWPILHRSSISCCAPAKAANWRTGSDSRLKTETGLCGASLDQAEIVQPSPSPCPATLRPTAVESSFSELRERQGHPHLEPLFSCRETFWKPQSQCGWAVRCHPPILSEAMMAAVQVQVGRYLSDPPHR